MCQNYVPFLRLKSHGWRSLVGCSPWGCEESDMTERLHFHFPFHALEKEMATHSSVLAWRIPGTGEPGGLPSMGLHRVGHDWSDIAAAVFICMNIPRFVYPLICWWTLMSTFWLSWIMLLWTQVHKYVFNSLLSIILGIHSELYDNYHMDHVIILFS